MVADPGISALLTGSNIGGTCTVTAFGFTVLAATASVTEFLVLGIFSVKLTSTWVLGSVLAKPDPLIVMLCSGGAERVLIVVTFGPIPLPDSATVIGLVLVEIVRLPLLVPTWFGL